MPAEYLEGRVFVYDKENDLIAYSNRVESNVKVVYVGGLGSRLPLCLLTTTMNRHCLENGYEFVIPQLRSYPNYGLFTIDDDIQDLRRLLNLIGGDVVLVGNSTGCQDIMHYLNTTGDKRVKLAVLLAAVSDVEFEECENSNLPRLLRRAEEMERKGEETAIKHKASGVYLTPGRILDIFSRRGKEDMFSSYLEDKFYTKLNQTGTRILFIISGKDEFAKKDTESKLRLVRNSRVERIPEATHVLSRSEDISIFLGFLSQEIGRAFRHPETKALLLSRSFDVD